MYYKIFGWPENRPKKIAEELENVLERNPDWELVTFQVFEHEPFVIIVLRDPFGWKANALTVIEDKRMKEE